MPLRILRENICWKPWLRAWPLFDYDNDGRLDIFVTNGAPLADPTPKGTIPQKTGPEYWNRLYHQKPDGTFEDVTEKAGLQGVGYGMGVAVGDYDNDGYEDLFVTAYGGNRLYHNNGNGTFTDVTASRRRWRQRLVHQRRLGRSGQRRPARSRCRAVYRMGFLRYLVRAAAAGLRVYCHPDVFPPIALLAYHNDGNGHFTEVAQKIGLSKPAKGLGIALADYDRDGHIDIYIANDSWPEFLFHNKGNGTFEEVGTGCGGGARWRWPHLRRHGCGFCRLQQRRFAGSGRRRSRQSDVCPLPEQSRWHI